MDKIKKIIIRNTTTNNNNIHIINKSTIITFPSRRLSMHVSNVSIRLSTSVTARINRFFSLYSGKSSTFDFAMLLLLPTPTATLDLEGGEDVLVTVTAAGSVNDFRAAAVTTVDFEGGPDEEGVADEGGIADEHGGPDEEGIADEEGGPDAEGGPDEEGGLDAEGGPDEEGGSGAEIAAGAFRFGTLKT